MIIEVYCDGGVIYDPPYPASRSSIGGTWAWCAVDHNGNRVEEYSGHVLAPEGKTITNNIMEQIAICLALEAMPVGWSGTVCSDSNIALGRVFRQWKLKNLPINIAQRCALALRKLNRVDHRLYEGHPTKEALEIGIGSKRGLPVSIHQDWCDKACKSAKIEAKKEYDFLRSFETSGAPEIIAR